MYRQRQWTEKVREEPEVFKGDRGAVSAVFSRARERGHLTLAEGDAREVVAAYGFRLPKSVLAAARSSAVEAAEEIGYPVVLKVVGPDLSHKSDVGGVALNLASAEELGRAAEKMRKQVNALLPQAQILGFTVQAMAERPGAHELIVGIASDPVFGPVMLLGEGGVAVELHKNHVVAMPPLNTRLAQDMLAGSRLSLLLAGYRGRPPADEAALLATLLKVSQMACDLAWLAELDINPLLVDEHGVLALDARVRLRPVPAGERSRLAIRPYPQTLEEHVQVKDQDVLLRPIRPEDGQRLMAFYAGASPADMRLRFFMTRREVPHSELARYSQIDYDREMTFVAMVPQAGGEPGAGEYQDIAGYCQSATKEAIAKNGYGSIRAGIMSSRCPDTFGFAMYRYMSVTG